MRRRTFLKGSAAAVGGAVALGFDLKHARAEMRELKIARTTETRMTEATVRVLVNGQPETFPANTTLGAVITRIRPSRTGIAALHLSQ